MRTANTIRMLTTALLLGLWTGTAAVQDDPPPTDAPEPKAADAPVAKA